MAFSFNGNLPYPCVVLLLFVDLENVDSQISAHQIRLFSPGKPIITTGPATYDSTRNTEPQFRDVGTRFANVATICAVGMWALYNVTNYGEGFEFSTSATIIRGYDAGACASSSTYPAFKSVQSIQYLGNLNPSNDGLLIYSGTVFGLVSFYGVGLKMMTLPAARPIPVGGLALYSGLPTGIRLGCLAITGTGRWRLCSDVNTCVCIDMTQQRGRMYLNPYAYADNITWPYFVRYVGSAPDSASCQNDQTPPVVGGAFANKIASDLDMEVFT